MIVTAEARGEGRRAPRAVNRVKRGCERREARSVREVEVVEVELEVGIGMSCGTVSAASASWNITPRRVRGSGAAAEAEVEAEAGAEAEAGIGVCERSSMAVSEIPLGISTSASRLRDGGAGAEEEVEVGAGVEAEAGVAVVKLCALADSLIDPRFFITGGLPGGRRGCFAPVEVELVMESSVTGSLSSTLVSSVD